MLACAKSYLTLCDTHIYVYNQFMYMTLLLHCELLEGDTNLFISKSLVFSIMPYPLKCLVNVY